MLSRRYFLSLIGVVTADVTFGKPPKRDRSRFSDIFSDEF